MSSLEQEIIRTALAMNALGINVNKSGNVSARAVCAGCEGFLITPTGIPYEQLTPWDIVFVALSDSPPPTIHSARKPSSEWPMHAAIYRSLPNVRAIVHTHSACATALACQEQDIPPFHYMVAAAGGEKIPCASYQPSGSNALAQEAARTLSQGYKECLLSHHGVIATGSDLPAALRLAHEVENLAKCYLLVLQQGRPKLLSKDQMAIVLERFKTYGQQ